MAAVLLVAGTLICAVSMLSPERLTPLALNVANKALDADVKASRVELGLKATFPFLTLQVDSLSIVSRGTKCRILSENSMLYFMNFSILRQPRFCPPFLFNRVRPAADKYFVRQNCC